MHRIPIEYNTFIKSLKNNVPLKDCSGPMKSMWHAKKNNWGEAHRISQDINSKLGSWIHAYLHRVEGDDWNAKYWYRQANITPKSISLDKEENQIIMHIFDLK